MNDYISHRLPPNPSHGRWWTASSQECCCWRLAASDAHWHWMLDEFSAPIHVLSSPSGCRLDGCCEWMMMLDESSWLPLLHASFYYTDCCMDREALRRTFGIGCWMNALRQLTSQWMSVGWMLRRVKWMIILDESSWLPSCMTHFTTLIVACSERATLFLNVGRLPTRF